MRSALAKACAGIEVVLFVKNLDRDVRADASEVLGAEEGAEARVWPHRFRSVRELLVPAVVLPIRGNFWSLTARRFRSLRLSGRQKDAMLVWGAGFRATLKRYRASAPIKVIQTREREAAAGPSSRKHVRRD